MTLNNALRSTAWAIEARSSWLASEPESEIWRASSSTGGDASTVRRCCWASRNCSGGTSTTSARPTLRSSHWSRMGLWLRISIVSTKGRPCQQASFAANVMTSLLNPANRKGPVPMATPDVFPSDVSLREMRNSSPASKTGRLGMGESAVKITEEPTARTAVHGQFAQEALNDCTTATEVSGEPSWNCTPGRNRNCQR